eukprot:3355166-Prymnesium_polylepis.1
MAADAAAVRGVGAVRGRVESPRQSAAGRERPRKAARGRERPAPRVRDSSLSNYRSIFYSLGVQLPRRTSTCRVRGATPPTPPTSTPDPDVCTTREITTLFYS